MTAERRGRQGSGRAFTGRSRRKGTRWTVKFSDIAARLLITVGGIGTIVAVCMVFVLLGVVVLPLFYPASIEDPTRQPVNWLSPAPVTMAIDEYRSIGWALYDDGCLRTFHVQDGALIHEEQLFENARITATSASVDGSELALGFEDGRLRFGTIRFDTSFHERRDVPASLRDLSAEQSGVWDQGGVQLTPKGQFRLQRVVLQFREAVQVASSAIVRLDQLFPGDSQAMMGAREFPCAVYTLDGVLRFCTLTEKENMFTGTTVLEHREVELPLEPVAGAEVLTVLLGNRAQNLFVAWSDGSLIRYDTRNPRAVRLAEVVNLLDDESARLTVCQFVLARETLVCGDSLGRLRAWFRVRGDSEAGGDELTGSPGEDEAESGGNRYSMAVVHDLGTSGTSVRSLGVSQRSRMIAAGYEDGSLRVFHVTTDQRLLETVVDPGKPVERTLMAPKDNGLFAVTGDSLWRCDFDPLHPEATVASLFAPVWYEGYDRPRHVWQSSFAGVASEMKLGMQPLVFGTLKATFYSMLLGAPLALLAAIYTSEFLSPRGRSRIKPVIEMMASLPSVVLGFLAALVFAPVVERVVPSILCTFLTLPLAFLLGSQLWQLIPYRTALRYARLRLFCVSLAMFGGILAAGLLGPVTERCLFAGDIKLWLDGQIGSGTGAWMFLMLPLASLFTLFLMTWYVNPWLRGKTQRLSRSQFAWINLGKFVAGTLFLVAAAYALSFSLKALGLDPRGSYLDTYEQRNALVVGFVMGFAIIPIIYTIADDALSTVPSHLRSGSLGCGATPWQTTWRVVIPTAMSGLFSALMIGLGRAVGETMIVLMAGGNTPVIDWNVFNGFRTLAANIAVEMPEAVRDSTHYRTLFLAALTLFLLTFAINTLAEVVRLRFRRRAYQL